MAEYTCPTSTEQPDGVPHTIIGCGLTFDTLPDEEGIIDCPRCGIWWNPKKEA